MFLQPIWTACGEGTLRCNGEDESLICDASRGYALNAQNGCEKKTVEGCALISWMQDGDQCLVCDDGKTYDANSKKCIDVQTPITGCATYNPDSSCKICVTNKFINNGDCTDVTTKVDNCMVNDTATNCKVCNKDYYLKNNACIKIKLVEGCKIHTNIKCLSCEQKYVLDPTYALPLTIDESTITNVLNNIHSQWTEKNSQLVCRSTSLSNCSTYKTFEKCQVCNSGYFLNDDDKCELFPEFGALNCLQMGASIDKCVKCSSDYYLDDNKCVLHTSLDDCIEYENNANKCKLCENDFLVDSLGKCIDRQVTLTDGCKTRNAKEDKCQTCNDGFTKTTDDKHCLTNSNHNHCNGLKIAANKEEEHKCLGCEAGYHLFNHRCMELLPNCKTMETDSDTKCLTCNPGNKIDGNNCINHNPNNCFAFEDKADSVKCVSCLPDYKKSGDSCVNAVTTENNKPDMQCKFNETTLDYTCSKCKSGYGLLNKYLTTKKKRYNTTANCAIYDDNGVCISCKPGYKNPTTMDKCSTVSTDEICTIKKDVANHNKSDPKKCYECNNVDYFINGEECNYRNWDNCDVNNRVTINNMPVCTACNSNFYHSDDELTTCVANISSTLNNCLVYESPFKCKICKQDYYIHTDGTCKNMTTEEKSYLPKRPTFDANLNPTGQLKITKVNNCEIYTQMTDSEYVCQKCQDNYVGIIGNITGIDNNKEGFPDFDDHTNTNYTTEGPDNSRNYISFWNKIDQCFNKETAGQKNKADLNNGIDNCVLGLKKDNGFGCIRCKVGYVGTLGKIKYFTSSDADGIIDEYLAIKSCELGTEDDKFHGTATNSNTFVGAGYSKGMNTNKKIQLSNYINITQCLTTDFVPVYNGYIASGDSKKRFRFKNNSESSVNNKHVYCLDVETNKKSITGHVDNCGIYALKLGIENAELGPTSNVLTNSDLKNNQELICIACKPGHVDLTNNFIKENCTAIQNCSQRGNWLNACEIPNSNNVWKYVKETRTVEYNILIANADSNCLVGKDTDECVLCKANYYVNASYECVLVSDYNTDCTETGFGLSGFKVFDDNLFKTGMAARRFSFTTLNALTNKDILDGFCYACGASFLLIKSYNLCTKANLPPITSNCEYREKNNECLKCKEGFARKSNENNTCIQNDKANCRIASDRNTCTECIYGYKMDNGECVAQNCKEFINESECLICKENYQSNAPTNKEICNINSMSTTGCTLFSASLGHCIACGNNQIPLVYKTGTISAECMTYNTTDRPFLQDAFNMGYAYLQIDSDRNNQPSLEYVENLEFRRKKSKTLYYADSDTRSTCLPIIQDDKCSKYTDDALYCKTCVDGYYWKQDDLRCIQHSTDLNCATFESDEDKCKTCPDDRWLNNPEKKCMPRENTCKAKQGQEESDTCKKCDNGKYGTTCQSSKLVTKCKTYAEDKDACTDCEDGYYLQNNSSSQECKKNPDGIENCRKYDNRTTCIACNTKFYLNQNECKEVTGDDLITGCNFYNQSKECLECTGVLALVDNKCGTALDSCLTYTSQNECSLCAPTKFLNANKTCEDVDQSNCDVADSTNDLCTKCSDEFYLKNDNTCDNASPITNCKVYENQEKCTTCKDEFILSADGSKCTSLTDKAGANCKNAHEVTDPVCETCDYGFKKNDTGGCDALDDPNCAFTDANNECLICNIGSNMNKEKACTKSITIPDTTGVSIKQSFIVLALLTMFLLR